MSEILRLYKYKSLLSGRKVVSASVLADQLQISRATLKRDLAKLREKFHLPVRFDRERGGYTLARSGRSVELPGLWLGLDELAMLGTLQQLGSQLEPGLMGGKLDALAGPLGSLLRKHGLEAEVASRRIRLMQARKRRGAIGHLDCINTANARRRRLRIVHFNRETGQTLEREVSPQSVVLYRDNWYLAAWCHLRDGLRTFAVDAVRQARMLESPAVDLSDADVHASLTASYGLFAGKPQAWAVLRFTAERARWVADEVWHARQVQRPLDDGSLELKVPYSDDRELVGELLRFGPDVLVLHPPQLRTKVQKMLLAAAARYVETPR